MHTRAPMISVERPPVLAVDDAPANLLALEAVLSGLGCEIVCAASGDAALRLAAERTFALVLLDVVMPGMDGFQTLARLRTVERSRATPVILVTARELELEAIEQAYELGAIDFIEKPINPRILKGKVTALLRLFEKEQENRRHADALRTKDQHLAVLAHDVRTPLSVIAIAALHLEQHTDPGVRTIAQRIQRASKRLQELNNDVLEAARMASGDMQLTRENVDLCATCSGLLTDFQSSYPHVAFSSELPAALYGEWDRMRLEQAISNLLSNAVKYGSGWVSLRLHAREGRACIMVSNACSQLSDEHIEELFAPYVQGAKHYSGVGLGLHIVREIARAHGGTASGHWAAGTITFMLDLPSASPTPEAADPQAELAAAAIDTRQG